MSILWETLGAVRARFQAAADAGLGHLEESFKRPMAEFMAAALQKAAQEKADSVPPLCPRCGAQLTQLRPVERTVQTSYGPIQLTRVTGRCRKCKTRVCPADVALGLEKGYSPSVQEGAALLASKMPVSDAAAVFQRLTGQKMAPTTLHRLAKEAGERAKTKRRKSDEQARQGQGLADGPAPRTLVIMMDAWNIRERDDWGRTERLRRRGQEPQRWHWVWTGTVFSLEARAQKRERPIITQRGYVATREGTDALSAQLHAEALRLGLGRAERVIVLGDGAPWIWNLAQDRFSQAVQRLDLYHLKQHLWAVARELYGPGRGAHEWMRQIQKKLRQGQAAAILQHIENEAATAGEALQAALKKELPYLREHQARMDYHQAQRRGEPSGSGAIESTCRQYQCRFKRPGQFWTKAGDDALLCLDTFWRNTRWSHLFPHITGLDPSRN